MLCTPQLCSECLTIIIKKKKALHILQLSALRFITKLNKLQLRHMQGEDWFCLLLSRRAIQNV